MSDLVGLPDCQICWGSGVMPDCHWVEPCMRCHPISPEQQREDTIFFNLGLLIMLILLVLHFHV